MMLGYYDNFKSLFKTANIYISVISEAKARDGVRWPSVVCGQPPDFPCREHRKKTKQQAVSCLAL